MFKSLKKEQKMNTINRNINTKSYISSIIIIIKKMNEFLCKGN